MRRTYTVVLEREPEGGFSVHVPALPGCHSQGETLAEALLMAQEAIEVYVEELEAAGEPVPEDVEDVTVSTRESDEVIVMKVPVGRKAEVA